MSERFAPLEIQRQPHMPYSVDKTMRLRRLEYQLEVPADAVRILAHNPNHVPTCLLLADYYSKQPDGAGLANFYRLKASSQASALK